ncbi:MAG: hypothetical protein A2445_00080 [Candidatus Jacksonbacteria bacterium RIFOXYC2_FULL_44_29]|nr:MAG: Nucleotidyltransferase substrate binding protein, HI0074 family [Parcubacteria group bacterium GW2011_GWC2_44_22]OGY75717.1 MAG: hypothetical protein A2240_06220 [Candidatus Jacksonbacteria bacterium RIFOXYA2_FULL_43_12]OGY76283.1 MAG: hypothetical protein A2295_00705 [Candidatus Jacksonbacteria bacterium RIFOXYB2_FULL_44_15]OGY78104.1 MAG: hypothetical protein A2445_00080 [Candidatus Jacksonbacteria bacterium RIFOXYC2_FULL_44_29]HCC50150.1 nucleotidyltransferase [Candidatus Jacksonbact
MDKKLESKIKQLDSALATLKEVLQMEKSKVIRDATIQRFEYCFELFWKCLRLYSLSEGDDVKSPKAAIRQLQIYKILTPTETETALQMADDRNLSVHTYDEQTIDALYQRIFKYYEMMEQVRQQLK